MIIEVHYKRLWLWWIRRPSKLFGLEGRIRVRLWIMLRDDILLSVYYGPGAMLTILFELCNFVLKKKTWFMFPSCR
jgi:hypothetical protein